MHECFKIVKPEMPIYPFTAILKWYYLTKDITSTF